MLHHVAKHILNNQTVNDACGFCGLSCDSSLEIKESSGAGAAQNYRPDSNFSYDYKFTFGAVLKTSKHSPFCNRPVICRVCPQVVWSYNLPFHYKIKHDRETREFYETK